MNPRRSSAMVLFLAALALSSLSVVVTGGTFTNPATAKVARQSAVPSWYVGRVTQINRSLGTNGVATSFKDSTFSSMVGTNVQDVALSYTADLSCPTNYPVTSVYSNLLAPTNGIYAFSTAGPWSITETTGNQTNTFTGTNTATSGSTGYIWTGNQTNSLAYAQNSAIDGELSGKTFSTQGTRFSAYTVSQTNVATNTFTPNTNLWTALDLSPVSAYNSNAGFKFQVTAISPRHILTAQHVAPPLGSQYNFVGSNGTVYTRTVVATQNAADDICIGLLDSDLPSYVVPAKVLPANYASYLSLGQSSGTYPMQFRVYYLDQAAKVCDAEGYSITSGVPYFDCQTPSTSQGKAFSLATYSGDSGCPVMMKFGGSTVLLCAWHFGGGTPGTSPFLSGSGPSVADQIAAINSAMTSLSTGQSLGSNYQLAQVSLSGFGTF